MRIDSVQLDAMRAIIIMAAVLALGACDNLSGEAEVKEAVSRNMLDPNAVQFRDLGRCSGDSDVWRGEFNGKNAYGAYTGFEAFFYVDGDFATVREGDFMGLMDRCYGDVAKPRKKTAAPDDLSTAADEAAAAAEAAADAAEKAAEEASKAAETP